MPSKIQRIRIKSGAIDGSGDATAYSNSISGKILAVHVNYPTNTCTVDIDSSGELKAQKIIDLAAANTDAVYYPRTPMEDNTGTDVTYDATNEIYTEFVVHGRLLLTIAAGTEDETVQVDIVYEAY